MNFNMIVVCIIKDKMETEPLRLRQFTAIWPCTYQDRWDHNGCVVVAV